MKKVKIYYHYNPEELEQKVNSFIAAHNVVDIQYKFAATTHTPYCSVLLVYEE